MNVTSSLYLLLLWLVCGFTFLPFSVLMFDLLIIDRRTGMPLNIKPRKDSQGFEIVDDYFPDSGLFHNPPFHNPILAIIIILLCM